MNALALLVNPRDLKAIDYLSSVLTSIALGTIRIHTVTSSEVLRLENCVCVGGPHAGTTFPMSKINLLIEQGWVQTEVVENRHHEGYYSVRIFVLAEDSRWHMQRGLMMAGRKLRKQILPYVDKSGSAWDAD
jgi:hypothetical protein